MCAPLPLLLLALALALGLPPPTQAARILGIFPMPSISHQLPYQAVMKALAARGHQITVISPNPLKEPAENYTDISLSFSYQIMRESVTFADISEMSPLTSMKEMSQFLIQLMDKQLGSEEIQDFLRYNSSDGFDLVIIEWLGFQALHGIIHAVGSPPVVGILSMGGSFLQYNAIGNPNNPAINPEIFTGYSDQMTFWERLNNAYLTIRMSFHWDWELLPQNEQLMRKYFGSAPPPIQETANNISLLILCNHWTTEYPRALLPNVVQLTGLHVREKTRPLPADLQAWLDGAGPQGVVYFSLGSNVMSKDLPADKLQAIVRALGRLPQRVLWKWEADALPGQPPNVRVSKWLPQQDILAHQNIRLFITQAGLQSFQEAAYHGVPLLAIPFMGDQHYNAAKMVSAGIGAKLNFKDVNEDTLYASITKVIDDPGYAERMRRFSGVYREHKAHSLETALWWVEYVLRHEGAPHLRAASLRLAWYELLLLDVAAAVALAALLLAAWALRRLWRALRPRSETAPSHANGLKFTNGSSYPSSAPTQRQRKDQ